LRGGFVRKGMPRVMAAIVFVAMIALLVGCGGAGSGDGNGYPISVMIFNISPAMTGNNIIVDVYEKNGAVYVQTGQISSQITGTEFTGAIMEYSLAGGGIGTTTKKYTGDVVLSMDIYIDVNKNGLMNDTGVDISDGVNFQDIPFSNEEVHAINYTALHVSGP
jgi:hypothetical protein